MRQRSLDEVHVDGLLERARELGRRELHLQPGLPPFTGLQDGQPQGLMSEYEPLTPLDIQQMVYGIMPDEQIRQCEREGQIAFSYAFGRRAQYTVHYVRTPDGSQARFRQVVDESL